MGRASRFKRNYAEAALNPTARRAVLRPSRLRFILTLALLGALALVSLAYTYDGAMAMFTSAGLEAPNVIAWFGLASLALTGIVAARLVRDHST